MPAISSARATSICQVRQVRGDALIRTGIATTRQGNPVPGRQSTSSRDASSIAAPLSTDSAVREIRSVPPSVNRPLSTGATSSRSSSTSSRTNTYRPHTKVRVTPLPSMRPYSAQWSRSPPSHENWGSQRLKMPTSRLTLTELNIVASPCLGHMQGTPCLRLKY